MNPERPTPVAAAPRTFTVKPEHPPEIIMGVDGARYALLRVMIGGMLVVLHAPVVGDEPTQQVEKPVSSTT
jgi:hypothetical protein